jgi:hypothetical protein
MMMAASAAGGGAYTPDAAVFDGTTQQLDRGADFDGNVDGKEGICSFWVNFNGENGIAAEFWYASGGYVSLARLAYGSHINKMYVQIYGAGGLRLDGTTVLTDATGWHHVYYSWNVATPAGWLWVDGADDLSASTVTDGTLDYTRADHTFMGNNSPSADVADFYLNLATSLDPGDSNNILKFRDGDGNAVDLGSDGSIPTGSQPIAFHHLDDGQAAVNFGTNLGSGGGMNITGTLTSTDGPNG